MVTRVIRSVSWVDSRHCDSGDGSTAYPPDTLISLPSSLMHICSLALLNVLSLSLHPPSVFVGSALSLNEGVGVGVGVAGGGLAGVARRATGFREGLCVGFSSLAFK